MHRTLKSALLSQNTYIINTAHRRGDLRPNWELQGEGSRGWLINVKQLLGVYYVPEIVLGLGLFRYFTTLNNSVTVSLTHGMSVNLILKKKLLSFYHSDFIFVYFP